MSFEDLFPDPFDQSVRKEQIIDYMMDELKPKIRQSISDAIHKYKNLQVGDRIVLNYHLDLNVDYEVKK